MVLLLPFDASLASGQLRLFLNSEKVSMLLKRREMMVLLPFAESRYKAFAL